MGIKLMVKYCATCNAKNNPKALACCQCGKRKFK